MLSRMFWLITPTVCGGLGHMVLLKTGLLRRLAVPIDGGMRVRERPLFGENKTWRGPVVMVVGTALATALQDRLVGGRIAARTNARPWVAGALIGLAYTIAELPNSFVKRQMGIAPGSRSPRFARVQYLIDQGDSVVGCLVVSCRLYRLSTADLVAASVLGTGIHCAVDGMLYLLGVKRR